MDWRDDRPKPQVPMEHNSNSEPELAGARRYVVSPLLGGIELLAAEYRHHVFPPHAHEAAVIGLVDSGEIEVASGGRRHVVRPGTLLLISPETIHEARTTGGATWTYRALYPGLAAWDAACRTLGVMTPIGVAAIEEQHLCAPVRRAHERLLDGSLSESALLTLLEQVVESALAGSERDAPESEPVIHYALEPLRHFLDTELSRRVSLEEMSATVGISRFHLLRTFTHAYGVSPYAYSLSRRLAAAQRQLSRGDDIASTALDFGFADQAHLTRHFVRTFGVSPGEFRRAHICNAGRAPARPRRASALGALATSSKRAIRRWSHISDGCAESGAGWPRSLAVAVAPAFHPIIPR